MQQTSFSFHYVPSLDEFEIKLCDSHTISKVVNILTFFFDDFLYEYTAVLEKKYLSKVVVGSKKSCQNWLEDTEKKPVKIS